MNGSPAARFTRFLLLIVGVLALGLTATSGASASLAVGPGSTFSTSYIDLPAGALPGGDSGYIQSTVDRSSLSSNGRYMAFTSGVNSMSADANPDYSSVFRKDRQTGAVDLVSRATGATGAAPAAYSYQPRISGDGNLVAFITSAALDPADVDDKTDVYVRNLTTKATILATPATAQSISFFDLSGNGLYVVFNTADALLPADTNNLNDVYRRNLLSGVVVRVSQKSDNTAAGNESSYSPSISGDGRWVTFASAATDLIVGFTNNNGISTDVFARNMNTNTNYLISHKTGVPTTGGNGVNGSPAIAGTPSLPADVNVSYDSNSTDVAAGDVTASPSIYLGKADGNNSILISRATGVAGANADSRANGSEISDDGKRVLFSTDSTNLGGPSDYYGAYVRNLNDNTTALRSNDNKYAIAADISGDGSRVAWTETGGFTPDSDSGAFGVFTRPTAGGTAEFTSRQPGSAPVRLPGAAYVDQPQSGNRSISADGRYVAFNAESDKLPGGTERIQAYRRDLSTGEVELVSRASGAAGVVSQWGSTSVSISADGSRLSFSSISPLVPADVDTNTDIYMRDFANDTTTLVSRADGPAGAPANANIYESMISGDGKRVVFSTDATNFGVPGGLEQVYVRDIASNKTILVSRDASANPGVPGNTDSGNPRIDGDGQLVVFESQATNLDPADAALNKDIYLRNLAGNKTTLVSRREGLAGATTPGFKNSPTISADGKVIAFETDDQPIAPEAGVWPAFDEQIVSRVLATGANALVSRAPGGAAAEQGARDPSVNGDGSVIAFDSSSTNLKPGLGGDNHGSVFVRQSATGAISGPPAFGQPNNGQGSAAPSISDNGQCLAFNASGFNQVSGDLSDLQGIYVNVVSGTCSDPRQNEVVVPPVTPKPKLTKVKLTHKKFAVSKKKTAKVSAKKKAKKKRKSKKGTKIKFTLNTNSSVTFRIEKKTKGRKVKGKCRKTTRKNKRKKKCSRFVKVGKLVRKNQKTGARTVAFSGRIGKKKLKPGKYRMQLIAYNSAGASNKVFRSFRVVKR